jgi:hypothetical protein
LMMIMLVIMMSATILNVFPCPSGFQKYIIDLLFHSKIQGSTVLKFFMYEHYS